VPQLKVDIYNKFLCASTKGAVDKKSGIDYNYLYRLFTTNCCVIIRAVLRRGGMIAICQITKEERK
ncbi:MAG: hypothetical protein LUC19_00025, partial [Oscillospiraceae bacterium]|nr:hypothetical protein [Oscillospiraceae bacterium]